jgi:transposase-like protein
VRRRTGPPGILNDERQSIIPEEHPLGPSTQFCPNFYCSHRGKAGPGNIRAHSRKERRFRCATCTKTFAASKNTPYYRLHKSLDLVTLVLTLLCHGCPRQAVVAAYGLDERTVADWQRRAGRHAQSFHELHVQQGRVDVRHARADGLRVKALGRRLWMAMALAVPGRLWLGGVVSRRRDGQLIAAVVRMVRRASHVTAFARGFRHKLPRGGRPGRPRLLVEPGLLIGQVIQRYGGRRVVEVTRLWCPFCRNRDHDRLSFLHGEGEEAKYRVSLCDGCRGYVKMVSSLSALPPVHLLMADIATLHLDLAAAERGLPVPHSLSLSLDPGPKSGSAGTRDPRRRCGLSGVLSRGLKNDDRLHRLFPGASHGS